MDHSAVLEGHQVAQLTVGRLVADSTDSMQRSFDILRTLHMGLDHRSIEHTVHCSRWDFLLQVGLDLSDSSPNWAPETVERHTRFHTHHHNRRNSVYRSLVADSHQSLRSLHVVAADSP